MHTHESSPTFHEWRDQFESDSSDWIAGLEYYRTRNAHDGFVPYTVTLNGETHTYPVFTTPAWTAHGTPLADLVQPGPPVTPVHDDAGISRVAARLAHRLNAPNGDTIRDDHLWNGDLYCAMVADPTTPTLRLHETDYYTYLSSTAPLLHDLLDRLYEADVSSTAEWKTIQSAVANTAFPYRERVAPEFCPTLTGTTDHPVYRPVGVTALPVFNTGDGYELLVMHRSSDVHSIPDTIGMIGGALTPHTGDSAPIREQLLCECAEELCSADEESSAEHPVTVRLRNALATGAADLDFVALVADGLRTNLHIRTLLFVDDPALYQYIRAEQDANWEADQLEYIPLSDADRLADILTGHSIAPPAAPGLTESLLRLETVYGIKTTLSLTTGNHET